MSLTWSIEEPGDNPLFKPLGVKNIRAKKGPPAKDSDFVGPKSTTKRNNCKADIVLKFNGKSFTAHKHVLRKASELFEKEPSFQESVATTKRPKPGSKLFKAVEFDLSAILPEDAKQFDTLNKVIDFAYTGRLPLATDVGFKHFFVTAVALYFHEALHVYEMYFIHLFKRPQRIFPASAAGIILTQCQKIRKPTLLSQCAEYLEGIRDSMSKYLLKEPLPGEPLGKLRDDAGFLAYLSVDALVAFLDRDDLAKPEDEEKVFNLALVWLKFDEENRQQYTKKVLKKVHLGLLPRYRLVALLSEVKGSSECEALVTEVLKLQDSKDDACVPLNMSHPQWFSPRKEMVIDALIGIGPGYYGGQSMVYFNAYGTSEESQGWQDWCEFEAIPHDIPVYDSSVVSIDGKLYIAGGICKPGKREYRVNHRGRLGYIFKWNSWFFHEGNIGQPSMNFGEDGDFATVNIVNPWTTLPEMKTVRNNFPMVYLDGYLYAIGGEDEEYDAIRDVDRYSFKDKKWEKIANLPVPCYYACATVYKGKILVYGSQSVPDADEPAQHDLQMYDPASKQWETLLTEHHKVEKFKKELSGDDKPKTKSDSYVDEDEYDSDAERADHADDAKNRERGRLLPRNVIVVDGGLCYRVIYPAGESSGEKPKPLVHRLEFDFQDDAPSCSLAECHDQQLMPTSGEGAFQIGRNVYVNMKGVVHKTGIKIAQKQTTEVDLGVWKKLQGQEFLEKLTFAKLTFDKKKIFCENCVREKKCVNGLMDMDSQELMAMMESDSD